MKELFKSTIIITILTSIPLIFFSEKLMLVLTNDEQLISIASKYLIVMGLDVCIRWIIGYFIYRKRDLYGTKDNLTQAL